MHGVVSSQLFEVRRLFKLPGLLEDAFEDYGQVAVYKVRTHHKGPACEHMPACMLHQQI